eukprot:m.137597 g.137597  ORF g.137597 m.137597 type:complete len:199 (+) comp12001_c0_seq1:225-821(+)
MTSKKNFKLILLGDIQVGKSSIVLRFVQDKFRKKHETTVGAAYLHRDLELESGQTIHIELWDTAGQERYKALAPLYFRGSQGAIIVFDVTKAGSFDKAKSWFDELRTHQDADPEIVFALVGNKVDLGESEREVSFQNAQNFAGENNMLYFETSAKDDINITELFLALGKKLESKAGRTSDGVLDNKKPTSSSTCCKSG